MIAILKAQWDKEKRFPYMVLILIACGIGITLLFGSSSDMSRVPVFVNESLSEEAAEQWIEILNQDETIEFVLMDEDKARQDVRTGISQMAVLLMENDYRIVAAAENPEIGLIEAHIRSSFTKAIYLSAAASISENEEQFLNEVEQRMETPSLVLNSQNLDGDPVGQYNIGIQLTFAFTLLTAFFTTAFKTNSVLEAKAQGVWGRMILSPISKTKMYLGYLIYSFIIGMVQIMIMLLMFRYIFQYNLGDNFLMITVIAAAYTLAIVALSMLIMGFMKDPEQFYTIIGSVAPIMALLAGSYWPPGLVSNQILLWIAEVIPNTHGLDALRGVSMYGHGWTEITMPIAKLLLIAVLCMGIGINLVERRVKA